MTAFLLGYVAGAWTTFLTVVAIALVKRWRRHKWQAAIIGEHSGNVTRLSFVTFRTEAQAHAWVNYTNQVQTGNGTHYEVRSIERGPQERP